VTCGLRRLGPAGRKIGWNLRFLDRAVYSRPRSELLLALVRRYGENRTIVELACGRGTLSRSMDFPVRGYLGMDVSDVAIREARAQAGPDREFNVGHMEDWKGRPDLDLLIIEEAIYYLPPFQQLRLLEQAFSASPDLIVILVIGSPAKYHDDVRLARESCDVVEEHYTGNRAFLVLARRRHA
jgi:hypothetical protein